MLDITKHKTQDGDKQKQKHMICVGHHQAQYTRRRQAKTKTQHDMCWTSPSTRHKTEPNKQKHNMICVGHHQAQDTRRRQTKTKIQHDMCWTSPSTRHKTETNKNKNTT